jgi:hypothetical protein
LLVPSHVLISISRPTNKQHHLVRHRALQLLAANGLTTSTCTPFLKLFLAHSWIIQEYSSGTFLFTTSNSPVDCPPPLYRPGLQVTPQLPHLSPSLHLNLDASSSPSSNLPLPLPKPCC